LSKDSQRANVGSAIWSSVNVLTKEKNECRKRTSAEDTGRVA